MTEKNNFHLFPGGYVSHTWLFARGYLSADAIHHFAAIMYLLDSMLPMQMLG